MDYIQPWCRSWPTPTSWYSTSVPQDAFQTRLLPQDPHIRRAETYGMWWGSRRKHDVVFISQHPINLYLPPPQSPAPPPPLTQPALTTSPSFPTIRPATPNKFLPRTYIYIPPPSSLPKSPQNLPFEAPTIPAQKTALPAAPPTRLQSCHCLIHSPISTLAQHPPSRPLHPHPRYPAPPRPSTTRTNAAPHQRPQPSILQPIEPPTDQHIPQHILKHSIPHIPLHLSSTHPARIRSPKTRATAPSRSATCSLQTLHHLTGPTPFALKP